MTTYARLRTDLSFDTTVDLSAQQYAAIQANGKAQWLRLYVVDSKPVPTSLQKLVDGPYITDATTTHRTWALSAKSQAEVDADTLSALQATEKPLITTALAVFDARTATSAQIQRAIAWLIRNQT
jgi:hypothetical protein